MIFTPEIRAIKDSIDALAGDDVALFHTVARHHACVLGERDGVALHDLRAVLILASDLDDHVLLGVVLRDHTGASVVSHTTFIFCPDFQTKSCAAQPI